MTLVIGEKELEQLPVIVDPEIVSGAPVFQGTRVPVEALISNLEAGLTPGIEMFHLLFSKSPLKVSEPQVLT